MPKNDFLLHAADITALPAQHKIHFLNANAVRLNQSLGDAVGMKNLGIHRITIAPGHASSEYHVHHDEEEAVYVLSGSGEICIDDVWYPFAAGDFAGFPAQGSAHTMRNNGTEDLVCLVIGQRLAHDVCDYPHLGKRLYRMNGRWDLVALTEIQHPK